VVRPTLQRAAASDTDNDFCDPAIIIDYSLVTNAYIGFPWKNLIKLVGVHIILDQLMKNWTNRTKSAQKLPSCRIFDAFNDQYLKLDWKSDISHQQY
jgi:hypothetical protein